MGRSFIRVTAGLAFVILGFALGGCGGLLKSETLALAQAPAAGEEVEAGDPQAVPDALVASQAESLGREGEAATGTALESNTSPERPDAEPASTPDGLLPTTTADPAEQPAPAAGGEPDLGEQLAIDGLGLLAALDTGPDPSLVLAFTPIRDGTLVQIMLGLREWPRVAQAGGERGDVELVEYDPWEPFNEAMFNFNLKLDRYVLKPVAKVWNKILPDEVQQMISRGFDNLRAIPRIVNSLLQAKWSKAGTETGRFVINSTIGFGGLWDMARQEFGIERPDSEDFGQTLGVWGVGPGPYLIVPVLAPTTVRDIIGRVVDGFMNPVSYFTPFVASLGLFLGDTINDRALNLELFQGFEETTLDFYSAVRNAYLARRARQIRN